MRLRSTIRKCWRGAAVATAGAIVLIIVVILGASLAAAQASNYGDKGLPASNTQPAPSNDQPPAILNGVGIDQHLNTQLPLNLTFTDDAGKQVALGSYFGKRPAILALVYYRCPMLCSEELDGLTSALEMVRFVPGKDFNIVVVSIDPTEGTDLAAERSAPISSATAIPRRLAAGTSSPERRPTSMPSRKLLASATSNSRCPAAA